MSLSSTNRATGFHRDQSFKGRGAALNIEGRFERWQREAFDDGWQVPSSDHDAPASPKTVVTHEIAKSIITQNDSPDIAFRDRRSADLWLYLLPNNFQKNKRDLWQKD